MTWKDILKSKKYEDMTDEEQAKIDRDIAEAREIKETVNSLVEQSNNNQE